MAAPIVFYFENDPRPGLVSALRLKGFEIRESGELHKKPEGEEQVYVCIKESKDLFLFCVGKLNDKNAWKLPSGTFFVMGGPAIQKSISEDLNRFADALRNLDGKDL